MADEKPVYNNDKFVSAVKKKSNSRNYSLSICWMKQQRKKKTASYNFF